MLHLKTFENFDNNMEDMTLPNCPLCRTNNVDPIGDTGDYECVDCGEIFCPEQFVPAGEPVSERYFDDVEDDSPAPRRDLSDDGADYEMDQEQKYYIDNKKILTILTNAKEYGEELVDQLNFSMEQCDSYLEFTQLAVKDIINILGVSDEEALVIFDELKNK